MVLIIIPLYLYSSNDEQFHITLKYHFIRPINSSVLSSNQDTKHQSKVQNYKQLIQPIHPIIHNTTITHTNKNYSAQVRNAARLTIKCMNARKTISAITQTIICRPHRCLTPRNSNFTGIDSCSKP